MVISDGMYKFIIMVNMHWGRAYWIRLFCRLFEDMNLNFDIIPLLVVFQIIVIFAIHEIVADCCHETLMFHLIARLRSVPYLFSNQ